MIQMKRRFRPREIKYVLQLTAMVDLFTILLVFLLKSYSTSSVQMSQIDEIRLPSSSAAIEPAEALRLVVSKKGIYIDEKQVVPLENGKLHTKYRSNKDRYFLNDLYKELDTHAKKSQEIGKNNEAHKFKGTVILQADRSLSYGMLKSVMYTAMLAGYADLKLGTMGME